MPLVVLACLAGAPRADAARPWASVSPRVRDAVDLGRSSATAVRHVVVGLAVRDRAALESFLADVQNPASPGFRRFLSPAEFAARFAPTPDAEAAVVAHLESSGLTVTERFANRLLVGAVGPTAAVERAFGVEVHDVALDGVRHFAATAEPALPDAIGAVVTGAIGLDDLVQAHPHLRARAVAAPRAAVGRNCCHLGPADLAALYDVPGAPDGTGQTVAIAGVFRWNDEDVSAFDAQFGLPDPAPGSTQICTGGPQAPGCRFQRKRSLEASLDVQLAHAMAPGARIIGYMSASRALADLATAYEHIVEDDPGHVVLTSWGACEANVAPAAQQIDDDLIASGNALGQAWFAASGDDGSRDCRRDPRGHHRAVTVDEPANSPHAIGVGGTSPTCAAGLVPGDPSCAGYGRERAWPSSGGGMSAVFPRPSFQTGCGIPAGDERLVPDVSLAADPKPGNYVVVANRWFIVGGTSTAVAMWGGLFTRVVEQAGGAGTGQPGQRLYALCGTGAFHDVTVGSNGAYTAGPGYDPVTGIGTPDVARLLAGF